MNYKTIGELGQNCAIGELSKYGLGIAPLLSDNYPFEFIVVAGSELFKIQVKTSSVNYKNEWVEFSLTTNNWHKGTKTKYTKQDCDVIICYDITEHNLFLLDDFEGRSSFTIRYKRPKGKNHCKSHWFEDYIISEKRIKQIFNFDVPNFNIFFSYRSENKYDLICQGCGKEFKSSYRRQKYCCGECRGIAKRTVLRASKEELIEMIKTMPMVHIGKKYGVSDNAVRKWARRYEIDIKKVKSENIV